MITKRNLTHIWLLGAVFLQTARLGAQTIQNYSFESPSVYNSGNNYYSFQFNPPAPGWSFSGNNSSSYAGIAANGSGYVYFSPNPVPDGSQCAFLQSISGGVASMSQTISVPEGNDFVFTYYASQRDVPTRDNTQNQTLTVQVDGVTAATITPPVGWTTYATTPAWFAAGSHTLTFSCAPVSGNATVLVDSVGMVPALTYTTANGAVTITGYNYRGGALTIPDTINGLPVTSIGTNAFANDALTSMTISTNVISIGDDAFSYCAGLTSVIIPNSVISIGDDAFNSCYSLTSIIIPNSVTSIGDSAFFDCTSLTNATIGTSVISIGDDAFNSCYSLTSIIIPNSVTSIGGSAFFECTSLTNATIGTNVISIGDDAFSYCAGLTNATIGTNVISIGDGAFNNCYSLTSIIIPNSVTSIGDSAFYDCTSLTNAIIGTNVISIGDDAFSYCAGLTSVIIPNSVTSMGGGAFYDCTSLTNATIGTNVTSIGDDAFFYCVNLTSVTIPNSVASIGDSAFNNCYNLTSIIIPNSVTSIGDNTFFDCFSLTNATIGTNVISVGDGAFFDCTSLTSVTIPTNVTSIGYDAFSFCTSLTAIDVAAGDSFYSSVNGVLFDLNQTTLVDFPSGLGGSYTIPSTVTNIGDDAFNSCYSLTNATIGTNVISIGVDAFSYCTRLTSITIPSSVTSIEDEAFYNCTSLTNAIIGTNVTSIGDYAFSFCTGLKAVYFQGNAPGADSTAFQGDFNVTAYYMPGTTGWAAFASATGLTPAPWPAGVQFTANPSNAPVGLAIQFTCTNIDIAGNVITNWNWNFGDGATGTNQNPAHVYASLGTFTPYLFANDSLGALFPGYGPAIVISQPPAITASLSKTNLVISGTNGFSGLAYHVLASTNLSLPKSQWRPVATNVWNANGNFTFTITNAVNRSMPKEFYILQVQ